MFSRCLTFSVAPRGNFINFPVGLRGELIRFLWSKVKVGVRATKFHIWLVAGLVRLNFCVTLGAVLLAKLCYAAVFEVPMFYILCLLCSSIHI